MPFLRVASAFRLHNMINFLKANTHLPGVVVEVGVYQGGSLEYLSENCPDREYYGYDTFSGMPMHDLNKDNAHREGNFSDTNLEMVKENLKSFKNIKLIPGLYPQSDTIKPSPVVMAHIDVDIYKSTKEAISYIWEFITPGGRAYFDDAFVNTCTGATIALVEFCVENKVELRLHTEELPAHGYIQK